MKKIVSTIINFRPVLVHSVAIKPVIYSAIACMIKKINARVFALAGLGFIFTSSKISAKILSPLIKIILKVLFYGEQTALILQNPDDKDAIIGSDIIKENQVNLIYGAGVDTSIYHYKKIPSMDVPLIILSARMLWAKGIKDFIKAAEKINSNQVRARFVLVGAPDKKNPDAVPIENLQKLNEAGFVEWWGYQKSMAEVYHQASIVCLPTTYGEGLPKSLLEAASCGRPIVTYDVPGCREIVKDGFNGFLIIPRDIEGLVKALSHLLKNYNKCVEMGNNGRKLVKKHFNQEKIAKETLNVWEKVLSI